MIRVEGMGWLGSVLTCHLAERAIPFTWSDNNHPHPAWYASTGLVYPTADARSAADLAVWRDWARGRGPIPPATAALIDYTYSTVGPPHGGPRARVSGSGWSISSGSAVRVDVQRFVRLVRDQFTARVTDSDAAAPGDVVIRAHGYTERLDRYIWGWHRPVRLQLAPELSGALKHHRTAIYLRRKYLTGYAYPIVDRPGWYLAGSSQVSQQTPHAFDAVTLRKRWGTWLKCFAELAPFVTVLDWEQSFQQGWRPTARPTDALWPIRRGNIITLPPLSHSGVRLAPSTVAATLEMITK